jgi:hypothetical protein
MTAAESSIESLNRAVARAHRSVLILLTGCAAVILLTGAANAMSETPRVYAYAATACGGLAILARPFRTGPIGNPKLLIARTLVSLMSAAGVGLIGVAAAAAGSPRSTALVYVLAGAIFALRPPRPLVFTRPTEEA